MESLFTSVLIASLIGSPHCVGMCGPLVAMAMREQDGVKSGALGHLGYHGGRLLSYVLLGLAAGALGGTLNLGGSLLGFQRIAISASAVFLIGFGLHQLLKFWTPARRILPKRKPGRGPGILSRMYFAMNKRLGAVHPTARATSLGLLSALLPCGWLYAFAAVAAGTGSAPLGALAMAAFWIGTVPLLGAFGLGMKKLLGPLERHLPVATALVLVACGLLVLTGRMQASPPSLAQASEEGSYEKALDRAVNEDPSCCSDE
ncbi:MAG: sulfite exporter TauE/SafE family protein [Planctomycetota bacterium]|nr:sulfite exporter TauE/SafE family protein [Planctomycetota bacterium]